MFHIDDFTEEELVTKAEVYISFILGGRHDENDVIKDFLKNVLKSKEVEIEDYQVNKKLYLTDGVTADRRGFDCSYTFLKKFKTKEDAEKYWKKKVKESDLRKDNIWDVFYFDSKLIEKELEESKQSILKRKKDKEEKITLIKSFLTQVEDGDYSLLHEEVKELLYKKYGIEDEKKDTKEKKIKLLKTNRVESLAKELHNVFLEKYTSYISNNGLINSFDSDADLSGESYMSLYQILTNTPDSLTNDEIKTKVLSRFDG